MVGGLLLLGNRDDLLGATVARENRDAYLQSGTAKALEENGIDANFAFESDKPPPPPFGSQDIWEGESEVTEEGLLDPLTQFGEHFSMGSTMLRDYFLQRRPLPGVQRLSTQGQIDAAMKAREPAMKGPVELTTDIEGADTDKDAAGFGMQFMGMNEHNIPFAGGMFMEIDNMPPEVQVAFAGLMDLYDKLPMFTWSGSKRLLKGLGLDFSTYLSLGSLAFIKQLLAGGLKVSGRQFLKTRLLNKLYGSSVIGIEGAGYAGMMDLFKQRAEAAKSPDQPFKFDLARNAVSASLGFAAGTGLTMGITNIPGIAKGVTAGAKALGAKAGQLADTVIGDGTTLRSGIGPVDTAPTTEIAPPFYSAVAKAVDELPQDKGKPWQMKAMIENTAGVKKEEMAWIGLDEFLKGGNKTITKQEIKDFVEANQVKIEEVQLRAEGEGSGHGGIMVDDELEEITVIPNSDEHADRVRQGIISLWRLRTFPDEFGETVDDVEIIQSLDYSKAETVDNVTSQLKLHIENDPSYYLSDLTEVSPEYTGALARFRDDPKGAEVEMRELIGDDAFEEIVDGLGEFQVYGTNGTLIGTRPDLDAAEYVARNHLEGLEGVTGRGDTHFGEWTIPGGTNYREVLLKLPWKRPHQLPAADEARLDELFTKRRSGISSLTDAERAEYLDLSSRGGGQRENYTQGHFPEDNVLAHVRLNDRTGPNGERILFVEEIQSDWHQTARITRTDEIARLAQELNISKKEAAKQVPEVGYRGSALKEMAEKLARDEAALIEKIRPVYESTQKRGGSQLHMPSLDEIVYDPLLVKGMGVSEDIVEQSLNLTKLKQQYFVQERVAVPDAPLKKTWHELSFRRIARMAAEEGYDKVAWTPGKVQADRYEKSRFVDAIEIIEEGNNSFEILVKRKGADSYQTLETGVHQDDLAKYIGKDLAQKTIRKTTDGSTDFDVLTRELDGLMERVNKGERLSDADGNRLNDLQDLVDAPLERIIFEGLDLEVGGEGMKAFYDEMVRNYAKKFGKKFGAKVETTRLARGSIQYDENGVAINRYEIGHEAGDPTSDIFVVRLNENYDEIFNRSFDTMAEAESFAKKENAKLEEPKVWSMKITQKMRDSLLKKGVPIFGAAGIAGGMQGQSGGEQPNAI